MSNRLPFQCTSRSLSLAGTFLALVALSTSLALPSAARARQDLAEPQAQSNGQQPPSAEQQPPANEMQPLPDHQNLAPEISPLELVRAAVENEVKDDSEVHLFSWKERKNRGHDTIVEHDVQTPDGVVSRVILINNRPLNAEQQRAEEARMRKQTEPEQMRRAQKDQRDDQARTRRMLDAIPNAFNFTYVETEIAPNGHKLITLNFTPNPQFSPPNRETMVFTGMKGTLVVDETAMRLAKVDGTLFQDVNFGWGIFGRLYKGGRFLVENCEITPTHWDNSRMYLHFDGKILLFKSLHIDNDETYWDYEPVQPMTVAEAVQLLNRMDSSQNALAAGGSTKLNSENRRLSTSRSSLGER